MAGGDPTPDIAPESGLKPPWKPGQSGNPAGRPKGARAKLGEAFIEAMRADFDKHGIAAVEKVRDEKPDQYLKVIASILPKELSLDEDTHDALAVVILQRREVLKNGA